MALCHSCKNKSSTDRCTSKAMLGLSFCKRHAKVKVVRLWADFSPLPAHAIKIQKIWRGYSVRNYLKLSGDGVLCRRLCHNDDEIFTLDEKHKQDPLNYFAFNQNGKLWWFDIRSINDWSAQHFKIVNPYNKEEIPLEAKQRLREIESIRRIRKLETSHRSLKDVTLVDLNSMNWRIVCQHIEESLCTEINPLTFLSLTTNQLWVFSDTLRTELNVWATEHTSPSSKRHKYCSLIKQLMATNFFRNGQRYHILYWISCISLRIFRDNKDKSAFCFMIVSALYRL